MATKAKTLEKINLADKARRCVRARELGQKNYKRADLLIKEIAAEIEPGEVIPTGEKTGFKLIDKYVDKDIVWTPCGARRWDLEKVDIS
jgi:hypothetical protein